MTGNARPSNRNTSASALLLPVCGEVESEGSNCWKTYSKPERRPGSSFLSIVIQRYVGSTWYWSYYIKSFATFEKWRNQKAKSGEEMSIIYSRKVPLRWSSGLAVVPFDITPSRFSERIMFKKIRSTTKKKNPKFILLLQKMPIDTLIGTNYYVPHLFTF